MNSPNKHIKQLSQEAPLPYNPFIIPANDVIFDFKNSTKHDLWEVRNGKNVSIYIFFTTLALREKKNILNIFMIVSQEYKSLKDEVKIRPLRQGESNKRRLRKEPMPDSTSRATAVLPISARDYLWSVEESAKDKVFILCLSSTRLCLTENQSLNLYCRFLYNSLSI